MSSTTDSARGQVLAIFALSLTALLAVTALAFDAGLMYVERRDQQNAADAAALAGARFLPDSPGQARLAARDVALRNGFVQSGNVSVAVTTPYLWPGKASNEPSAGFIEVEIGNTRPSLFAGVLGILDWPVSARAVAANEDDVAVDFSILALNETACPGMEVSGGGKIVAAGDIQVDSSCGLPDSDKPNGEALKMVNTGTSITVEVGGEEGACSVHGMIKGDTEDPVQFACKTIEGAKRAYDPFAEKPAPPGLLDLQAALLVDLTDGELPPDGCPGSSDPATSADPGKGCQIPSNYKDKTWLVYPGLYPGGLKLNSGTFYLLPGVYYIEGGGVDLGGGGVTITSVDSAGTVPAQGGGVLIYNTKDADGDAGPVNLNGANANIYLEPYQGSPWDGFVVFQDRTIDEDIEINGSDSDMAVRGLIYAKLGHVKINGSAGTLITDQIIADTFIITGGGGNIDAKREAEFLPTLTLAGLVE